MRTSLPTTSHFPVALGTWDFVASNDLGVTATPLIYNPLISMWLRQ
jgi:hypothetical protein